MHHTRRTLLIGAAAFAATPAHAQIGLDEWIPYDDSNGLPFVAGTVNGEATNILVDSGAGETAIDFGFAARMNIPVTDQERSVQGVADTHRTRVSGAFALTLGRLAINIRSAVVADLSVAASAGVPLHAIIGRNLFERAYIDFDLANRQMAIRQRFEPYPGAVEAPLRAAPRQQRHLDIAIGDRAPVEALFDTGNNSALMVSRAYAEENGLLTGLRTSTWLAGGIDGVVTTTVATLPQVRIGPRTVLNVPVDVYERWNREAPACVGFPLLRTLGRLTTDYARSRYAAPGEPAQVAPELPRNRSGVAASPMGDRLRVLHVAPNSPAALRGWRVGDEIAAIDGVAIAQRYNRLWGNAAAGSEITLTMSDGASRRLVLADYF